MARGVNFLIYVNVGTDEKPEFKRVAGQRGGTLSREYDTIDVTSKDNFGWTDNEYGNASWTLEGDGILVESDETFQLLEEAFHSARYVLVRFVTQVGTIYQGLATIGDLSVEAPYDDTATYSLTLNGKGAYKKIAVTNIKKGTWKATGKEGVHDDILYVEFELLDEDGARVPLDAEHIEFIREDGRELEVNEDETLWFNKARPGGKYNYQVKTKEGVYYEAALEWDRREWDNEFGDGDNGDGGSGGSDVEG